LRYKAILKDHQLDKLIHEIRERFKDASNSIHKARNEIKIIDYNEKKLVVKSFKIPNMLNKIVYTFFKDSKAKKSYDNAIKISAFTPKAIAYVEFQKSGLLDESYFISENFEYDFTIREPLLDENFSQREAIFQAFASFSHQLHEEGIYHLDYSPGNILIKKEKEGYNFKIVDINRMKFKKLSLDERLKNFSKLWAKDEDMKIIVKEYAKLMNEDEAYCINKAIAYSQKNKDIKNFKKRLKGKKVHD
jgi:serine/threonine protein kinase